MSTGEGNSNVVGFTGSQFDSKIKRLDEKLEMGGVVVDLLDAYNAFEADTSMSAAEITTTSKVGATKDFDVDVSVFFQFISDSAKLFFSRKEMVQSDIAGTVRITKYFYDQKDEPGVEEKPWPLFLSLSWTYHQLEPTSGMYAQLGRFSKTLWNKGFRILTADLTRQVCEIVLVKDDIKVFIKMYPDDFESCNLLNGKEIPGALDMF